MRAPPRRRRERAHLAPQLRARYQGSADAEGRRLPEEQRLQLSAPLEGRQDRYHESGAPLFHGDRGRERIERARGERPLDHISDGFAAGVVEIRLEDGEPIPGELDFAHDHTQQICHIARLASADAIANGRGDDLDLLADRARERGHERGARRRRALAGEPADPHAAPNNTPIVPGAGTGIVP